MKIRLASLTALLAYVCSAYSAIPQGYYDSCEGKTGRQLLKALEGVISKHTNVGYDGLWDVYHDSDLREDGSIWDMYSTKDWTSSWEKYINKQYKKVGDGLNREHSFPKSWFNNASPMNSDAFHIYPTDGYVNNQRSNFPYGECAGGETKRNGDIVGLGKLGTCTFPGYSGKVFEPDDQYKGDFARTYFYMAACYNSRIAGWHSDALAGNDYPCFTTWTVNLFMKWTRSDQVSRKEIDRNEGVFKHQKNRNPFIDHPELAEYIWGDKVGEPWHSGDAPGPGPDEPTPGPGPDDPTPGPGPDDPTPEPGDFIETFENPGGNSYSAKTYKGTAATWSTDALFAMNASDSFPHEGEQAARTNKTGLGFLEMTSSKADGAGTVSFWARVYKTDPDGEFTVKISSDEGKTWTDLGNVTVSGGEYKRYAVKAEVKGNVRVRLDQTSGKRVMIDDLAISDFKDTSVIVNLTEAEYAAPEYYNLQGIRILEPVRGQLYIRVQGRRTSKIIF